MARLLRDFDRSGRCGLAVVAFAIMIVGASVWVIVEMFAE